MGNIDHMDQRKPSNSKSLSKMGHLCSNIYPSELLFHQMKEKSEVEKVLVKERELEELCSKVDILNDDSLMEMDTKSDYW